MSGQDILGAGATAFGNDVARDSVVLDASSPARRSKFADLADLKSYLGEMLGAKADGDGVRGKVSRTGKSARRAAEGGQSAALRDPLLDAIASPDGTVVIGDKTINLRDNVVFSAPALKHTGNVNGAERWATDDGSLVEYRIGTGRLDFHAYKKREIGHWSMGAEISISGTVNKFKAASIESGYFMSVTGPCQVVKVNSDSDRNDDYLDEYEWGINAQQPETVASACRALWHNAYFADVVIAGGGCKAAAENMSWDRGEPVAWLPINTVLNLAGDWNAGGPHNATISIDLHDLAVNMSAFNRPTAHGSIKDWSNISVTFPDDKTYTGVLEAPNKIRWSNNTVWTKVLNTVIDLNGKWIDFSGKLALVSEGAHVINVDMSDHDRPAAKGTIIDASNISVKFPDEGTYTAVLQAPNTIAWSNGTSWTRHL